MKRIAVLAFLLLLQGLCMDVVHAWQLLPPVTEWKRISSEEQWKAVSLSEGYLEIADVNSLSEHVREEVEVSPYDYDSTRDYNRLFKKRRYPAFDAPAHALFVFQLDDQKIKAGRYRSLIPSGTVIAQG